MLRTSFPLLAILALSPIVIYGQALAQTTQDIQATDVLNRSLSAVGAGNVQGFTASGQITYYWGGQAIQANATIRAKGGDQFRLDADVPGGTKSIAFSHRTGSSVEPGGKASEIPAHNMLTAGVLTFPYLSIASMLSDSTVFVSYVGVAEIGAQQLHQIRFSRVFSKQIDPDGTLAKLSAIDYFIDPKTYLVVRTADLTHPKQTLTESYTHEVEFDGYTAMSGITFPTIVREKVGGQKIWELQVSNMTLNPSLTDADFTLQ